MNKTISGLFLILLVISACRNQKSVVYPEYLKTRNTRDSIPHLNDSTLLVQNISTDVGYGRKPEKPIFLGVFSHHEGGKNRIKFFNSLLGPDGKSITAYRLKSCCPFKTLNSHTVGADQKFGLLDIWIVETEGYPADTLFVNPYDQGELLAPTNYTLKTNDQ